MHTERQPRGPQEPHRLWSLKGWPRTSSTKHHLRTVREAEPHLGPPEPASDLTKPPVIQMHVESGEALLVSSYSISCRVTIHLMKPNRSPSFPSCCGPLPCQCQRHKLSSKRAMRASPTPCHQAVSAWLKAQQGDYDAGGGGQEMVKFASQWSSLVSGLSFSG